MNVAIHLWSMAARTPGAVALEVQATGERLTFSELASRASAMARGLQARGIGHGDRVLLMVRPGADFAALAFALLALGAVAVFIDPSLGRRRLMDCIAQARPKAIIAERILHAFAALHRRTLAGVKVRISVGRWPGATCISRLRGNAPADFAPLAVSPRDDAIVAFTSGATGAPKGVLLQHSVLAAQLASFIRLSGIGEGDVYLAILPLLAILGPGFGCATVLPAIDPSRPRDTNPQTVLTAIRRYGVTHSFGSPAVWRKIADAGIRLPTMRCLMIGGAPVPAALLRALTPLLPNGRIHTPYGATEAVPLTCAEASEILAEVRTDCGMLVGRPLPGVELRIVAISDEPLAEATALPAAEIGEIVVRGPVVSRSYERGHDADALAKIPDSSGAWHRTGDLGVLDEQGRLWFCGRKSERVESAGITLFTACVEPRFDAHPAVKRAALVGARGKAVLVVEPKPGAKADAAAAAGILALRGGIPIERILFKDALPLDGRHAAKILRGELARWAEGRVA